MNTMIKNFIANVIDKVLKTTALKTTVMKNLVLSCSNEPISVLKNPELQSSVVLNKTTTVTIPSVTFGNIPSEKVIELFKDGRVSSHFIEVWISENFPVQHVKGCKKYDFIDEKYPDTKYDEKTFTKRGCNFCPSNMLGQGRKFDKVVFQEKTKNLIFCIASVVDFPVLKVKFVRGTDLIEKYPKGSIPFKDHIKFFN